MRALSVRRDGGNSLIAAYHDGLARHWPPAWRLAGHVLAAIGQGGWSAGERLYLGEAVRAQGLSMKDRKGMHRLINPGAFPLSVNILKNKQLFAKMAAGLPLPDACDPDVMDIDRWLAGQTDIIAKPSYRSKGQGVERFVREGDGWRNNGHVASSARIALSLRALWRQGGVIQQRLPTHDALADLSPGALPTLRVVTCLNEDGAPEACATALRLSAGGPRPVDNFNAGNLVLAVDGQGRCGAAWRSGGKRPPTRHSRHPATGAPIAGATLPDHDAALALALRAHERFRAGFTVIGWDIGLTARGPVLVEGNWNPGTDILQLVEGRGLAQSRLGTLYRHALARLSVEQWRAAAPVQRDMR
ncbi:sugar-transfer associated ATP-grasp domain-containing protein [Sphingobium sp. HBC34]|uniref:Sugar-transfer associated ATP-grasp domain-containing protein n=1 Tax=Sphingobium cyanobacteriorum TaxID=3063954 RepID=A0ABT8ZR84_9SPHN|nr:sugar-transfer associated ATP-grasp domain-containing protein [Sphingobium sp. HBC34]MDO7835991.1 sugar-transfer associated ATP-grasp domain-containing protein [Sphingobium sp. HBC34]